MASSSTALEPPPAEPAAAGPKPPRWITILDIACIVLLVYAVRAMFGFGGRITLGALRLSIGSWPRLLMWAAATLVIRHALWRTVPWHVRTMGWVRRTAANEAFRAAWAPFVASRLLVLGVGYVAVAAIGFNPPRPWRALNSNVLDLFARWDGGWYFTIASVGYIPNHAFNPTDQNSIAFFPGLPLLMRLAGRVLAVNLWVGGIIVVAIAFFWGLLCVYRLAREDMSVEQARVALVFLAFYPFAVSYSAVLTESLYLLAAAASFLYLRRDRLLKAAAFAFFIGLVRPNGFLISLPLALTTLIPFARARRWLPGAEGAEDARWATVAMRIVVSVLPIAGMLVYAGYVYTLTGDPFAWGKAQQAWGRSTTAILDLIAERAHLIATRGWSAYPRAFPIEALEAGAGLFGLAAVWPITRRFGLPYAVFVLMGILPSLVTMGTISLGRYTAPLFPIFLWLGASIPERGRMYWVAGFSAGQALIAALFYTWRPPY